jgi:hypothetical protein
MKSKQCKTNRETPKLSSDPDLREQIEIKAYEIWLADGSRHGNDISQWFQAESEVLAARQKSQPQA